VISDEIVAQFTANASKAAANVVVAQSPEELPGLFETIAGGKTPVFCPSRTDLEKELAGVIGGLTEDFANAALTVEEVFGGVAESGSIICSSADGKIVQAGLLPAQHVAVIRRERIFATMEELLASFGETPPTNITFITGPSRTADIELTLTIGVHGPERLDVIVI
jgi:L-lactate dehydrogenase complex protein LldG